MAPLKSSLARALRSHLSTRNSCIFSETAHALGGTTRNVTSTGTPSRHTPSIYNPQGKLFLIFTNSRILPSSKTASHVFSDFLHPAHRLVKPAPTLTKKQTPFDTLLNNLTTHLSSTPPSALSPQLPHLFSLLRAYQSDPAQWANYAYANPSKQYTRNLVCSVEGVFNLLLLVWTPGKKSPVHDHADAHCLMKILQGSVRETRFAVPQFPGCEGPLREMSRVNYVTGKVAYMADSVGTPFHPRL
jgi:cysteine dioxygenase